MRTTVIIAAVALQILVLGWMAGQREWIVATGSRVWLRTAPVDPRDLFRGDYVILGYEISTIDADKTGPALRAERDAVNRNDRTERPRYHREIEVYSQLELPQGSDVAQVRQIDLSPPDSGLFIKGRVRPFHIRGQETLSGVSYGIDAFFVEQGKGRELERNAPQGAPSGVRVPLEMQVALGRDGTAVLTDYRWNPLGVGLEIRKDADRSADHPEQAASSVRLILNYFNASSKPLAMVLPSDLHTIRLTALEFRDGPETDATPLPTDPPRLRNQDVRILGPGETVSIEIDPQDPRWMPHLPNKEPQPLWNKDLRARLYRLTYQAPLPEECVGLENAALIWRGRLPSREFGPYELDRTP
jgi:uncharacterized membrane-anchored protein